MLSSSRSLLSLARSRSAIKLPQQTQRNVFTASSRFRFPKILDVISSNSSSRDAILNRVKNISMTNFRRYNEKYNNNSNKSREKLSTSGISGFCLGFLGGLFQKKEKLSPEDELLLEIKRAVLAIQEGEIPKAERHLLNSWKMTEELDRDDVRTQIMDIQANLAYKKGELDRAIRLFQLVTQRMVYHQGVKTNDNAIVEISIKLAQIYSMQGKEDEAMSGFQFCADTQREKIKKGEDDEDTLMLGAWSLQSLAQAYMTHGTKKEVLDKALISKAAECAKEAYKYATEAVGSDSEQAIAISSDLASILALQGNVEGAIKKLEECEKIASEKHQYLQAAIRVNTGSLYLQKGEYSEAQRICKEAKMIAGMFHDLESVMRADECIAKSSSMKSDSDYYKQTKKSANAKTGLKVES